MTNMILPEDTRELVAHYATRPAFERAVADLLAAGFAPSDLSVLASHDSLEVAGDIAGYHRAPLAAIGAGLAGELPLLAPLALTGLMLAVSGPVGVAVAAVAAAAGGTLALRPVLDQITETAHATQFSDAVAKGHILLWVRTADAGRVGAAETLLRQAGGTDIVRLRTPVSEAGLAG